MLSILAAMNLHSGDIFANLEERHRSCEFIGLLGSMDEYYPAACRIRVFPDNYSAHIARETNEWLATRAGRFEYVDTPKHGS